MLRFGEGLMGLWKSKSRRRFRFGPKSELATAPNGLWSVSWPDAGDGFFTVLCLLIRFKYNLRRMGHTVYSPYTIILPDLVGPGFRLKAGWDDYSGYYLLSEDRAGDEFLRRFAGTDE